MKKIKIKGDLKAIEAKYVSEYAGRHKSPVKRGFSWFKLKYVYYFFVYTYEKNCGNCRYYTKYEPLLGACSQWRGLHTGESFKCSKFKERKHGKNM